MSLYVNFVAIFAVATSTLLFYCQGSFFSAPSHLPPSTAPSHRSLTRHLGDSDARAAGSESTASGICFLERIANVLPGSIPQRTLEVFARQVGMVTPGRSPLPHPEQHHVRCGYAYRD
ncbi:hypothetical protein FB567DRAFT_298606 [Paraphoma chrysanthemicola]|uniref:Uncharacterized protein n=1 Tax=Paraphoma chrysanthemicola TaxID=798071 RepID=A0A8K0W0T8_9PLEO|nr:hypothetical protein FB567DRAFT_298606 [Paraphoma chrysanthemicola]